jgi:hypothetical protein
MILGGVLVGKQALLESNLGQTAGTPPLCRMSKTPPGGNDEFPF